MYMIRKLRLLKTAYCALCLGPCVEFFCSARPKGHSAEVLYSVDVKKYMCDVVDVKSRVNVVCLRLDGSDAAGGEKRSCTCYLLKQRKKNGSETTKNNTNRLPILLVQKEREREIDRRETEIAIIYSQFIRLLSGQKPALVQQSWIN